MSTPAPAKGLFTKLAYGFGSVAYGVKDNGFAYFLLLFYSQVLGVPAGLAGLAIFLAIFIDAVTDPLVGYLSDHTHSRWGRRHPYMYASALPVAIVFYFLWNPPDGMRGADLFPYLLALSILINVSITFYEIPSTALVAELTDDYDQRTSFLSYRYFFGWVGGIAIAIIMLNVLLKPSTPGGNDGYFNVDAYGTYGLIGGGLIFLSIIVSSLGTHRHIPYLRRPPIGAAAFSWRRVFSELAESLNNQSFFAIFFASLIFGMAAGLSTSLSHYFNSFFWELLPAQAGIITVSALVSAMIALIAAPIVSKTVGKKTGAITVAAIAFATAPMPIFLRLMGWFPDNGTDALFYTLIVIVLVDVALIIVAQILITSMLADVVEDSETKTGRRSEGVFFAAQTFARKAVNGLGVLMASAVLSIVQFPENARPEAIDPGIVHSLGLVYAPTILMFYLAAVGMLFLYRIDRKKHEDNLSRLGVSPLVAPLAPAAESPPHKD